MSLCRNEGIKGIQPLRRRRAEQRDYRICLENGTRRAFIGDPGAAESPAREKGGDIPVDAPRCPSRRPGTLFRDNGMEAGASNAQSIPRWPSRAPYHDRRIPTSTEDLR